MKRHFVRQCRNTAVIREHRECLMARKRLARKIALAERLVRQLQETGI
jgi:hypothetical protein